MPNTISQRTTAVETGQTASQPAQKEDLAVNYCPKLEQVIQACEEKSARQVQQRVRENQSRQSPYGLD